MNLFNIQFSLHLSLNFQAFKQIKCIRDLHLVICHTVHYLMNMSVKNHRLQVSGIIHMYR